MKKIPLFFIGISLIFSCNTVNPKNYISISGYTQGTTYHITYNSPKGINYQADIEELLNKFNLSLSIYNSESIVSRINRNDSCVIVDEWFITVYKKSLEVYKATEGAFDITVGPLVNAWGFGPEKINKPDSITVDYLLQFIGMDKIDLKGDTLYKQFPEIKLDFNAIAQGYSADIIAGFLDERGVIDYMVEVGGEIIVRGVNKNGNLWRIGIDKPLEDSLADNRELQAIINLTSKALATSGNYRKYYEEDGIKYSHSINPKTGYPEKSNLLSVTVLADKAITADAYATSFMIMGMEKSYKFAVEHEDLEAYFIYSDEQGNFLIKYTEGFSKIIETK